MKDPEKLFDAIRAEISSASASEQKRICLLISEIQSLDLTAAWSTYGVHISRSSAQSTFRDTCELIKMAVSA